MRWIVLAAVLSTDLAVPDLARAEPTPIRCEEVATADLSIDGLLDDWGKKVLFRAGTAPDGIISLRCGWDGTALALALDVADDRVVRLHSKGHEDHVTITVGAGGKPVNLDLFPGNALAKARIVKPAKVAAADSLQAKGFSLEARIPAAQLAGFTASTPALDLRIVFVDSDKAAGGDTTEIVIDAAIELGDRKDLLDDFLRSVRLKRSDVKLDKLDNLDPDRRGNERIVAGGTVIGVLTDQFAFVSLPAAKPSDVKKVELLPLGAKNLKIVSAIVRQAGNGGSRDLLMLWTVWSGQLQPLAQIEIRKEQAGKILETSWKLVKGKKGSELRIEPKPAVGWTAETWNEMPADDSDPILLPWDTAKGGVAYSLKGAEVTRRDLPVPKKKR
ncbi:MAG: hypothetical protein H0T42_10610 [Deltaproteobacteria bacterium]|nr:hypothetical protein [Deltaproteobacteria bacterium]